MNQLAQVFRECKREKANDELVEMAMKELEKMHAKMPEYLRISAVNASAATRGTGEKLGGSGGRATGDGEKLTGRDRTWD